MNRLRLHDLSKSRADIELERMLAFAALPAEEQIRRTIILMNAIRTFNGGRPLKQPQGKGYIFYKTPPDGSL